MSAEIEELKMLKKSILSCVQSQNLKETDTEEMGDAIDMIKDLSEAIYYCTIAEGMEKGEKEIEAMEKAMLKLNMDKNNNGMTEKEPYYYPMYYTPMRDRNEDWRIGKMYHRGYEYPYEYEYPVRYASMGGSSGSNGGSRGNAGNNSSGGNNAQGGGTRGYSDFRDSREGRSGQARRMYMESKEMNQDESTQMVKLKEYIDDLTDDMTEIAKQMPQEHKQMLQQNIAKISNLIGQMK